MEHKINRALECASPAQREVLSYLLSQTDAMINQIGLNNVHVNDTNINCAMDEINASNTYLDISSVNHVIVENTAIDGSLITTDEPNLVMNNETSSLRLENFLSFLHPIENNDGEENNCSHDDNKDDDSSRNDVKDNSQGSSLQISSNIEISQAEEATEKPKLKLTRIEQSNNYYDQNGYIYSKTQTKTEAHSYFRCKHFVRNACKARAIASNNDLTNAVLSQPHRHRANKIILDDEKFNKRLDKMCKEKEFEKPLKLYLETKKSLNREIDTANVSTPKSKESFIRRRKILKEPKLPKTIEEFMDIMADETYGQYSRDERGSIFFRGNWKVDGLSNLVFISERTLDMLNTMDNIILLMDGTFKVLPRHFRRRFRQLYVINIVYNGRCYPLAFVLMQTKNFKAYDYLLGRLRSLFPSVSVSCCMSDYEAATRKALIKIFPSARLCGCFFHYVQAIHKAFKKRGMLKDEKFQDALQEVSTLALLPNDYIEEGFETVHRKMQKYKSKRWTTFSCYFRKQWLKANISVYGLDNRSNNFSESLNNIINNLNGPKPTVWQLITNLKLLELHKSDELENNIGGLMYFTKKSQDMIKLNEKIMNATELFKKDRNVENFLQRICFKEKLDSYFASRIFIDGVDEDEFDDDCEECDDDVIPNWFNIELTFDRGSLKRKIPGTAQQMKKKCNVAFLY